MNFSASAHSDNISETLIHSLQDWWALAGVDSDYVAAPTSLLEKPKPKPSANLSKNPVSNSATEQALKGPKTGTGDLVPDFEYPPEYDAFMAFLQQPGNLVETDWARNFVYPQGPLQPKLMVVAALPDQSGSSDLPIYSDQNRKLLMNMLRAIGHDSHDTYFASLALARPIDGRIDPKLYPALKKRIYHHINLVQPKKIILFGDSSAKLFFDQDLLAARKKKQFINHVSSTVDAIVTFHPRILIERPEFKAEAWQDLQMLTRTSPP